MLDQIELSAAQRVEGAMVLDTPGHDVVWKLPVYNTIWLIFLQFAEYKFRN